MNLEIVPFGTEHLEDAAARVAGRYSRLREQVPSLPARYAEPTYLLPLLNSIVDAGPGVAALRDGRLVGFLVGWLLPSFRGRRAAFCPEWAHAADAEHARRIYEAMYTHLSASWVEDGTLTHLISMLADDGDGIDLLHWLGFGMIAADAVRGLQPVQGAAGDVSIRRAGVGEVEEAVALSDALQRHMASAPTFLAHTARRDRRHFEEWLADPANALWLAYDRAEPVGFIKQGPANTDACTIIRDEKTTSIVGAYTREGMRDRGIASALLNRTLDRARDAGYERIAVDFEPMNPLATRFWLRHFRPVCYTLVRHVEQRDA